MSLSVLEITDASFQTDVLDSPVPVLVDFWAPWCGPCKMISPILEQLAASYSGKLKIVKINVDENAATPARYTVRSIPTLILFKNGELAAQQVGTLPRAALTQFLEASLKTGASA